MMYLTDHHGMSHLLNLPTVIAIPMPVRMLSVFSLSMTGFGRKPGTQNDNNTKVFFFFLKKALTIQKFGSDIP